MTNRKKASPSLAMLRAERLAALNLMEDAVVAQRESDRANAALRASESRLRTLADFLPQVIWTNTAAGMANYFNLRWYEYSGLTFTQSVGLGWEAIVHPADAARAKEEWQDALSLGEVFDCEYRLRRADGVYRWFIGRNVPLKDAKGDVTGWFGSATDIQDLKTAQELLHDADRRKNRFLAMLGHELRNPLAAIRNGVLLLRSEKARPESRAVALPIVSEQIAHMERLVDDLLDLTRIVEGKLQVERQPLVLQDVVQRALEMIRPQAEAEKFQIDVHAPPPPLPALGDAVRLTQVFVNILGNAIKYSGASRRIEISLAREERAAVVRVRDYGLGIPAALLPHIFEPFMQGTVGLTLESGLGLGLAVVRELVQQHDGTVTASSAGEGRGSEFVVRLPLSE